VADLLRRIERRGSTQPLYYSLRDVRGVEPVAADPTDRAGYNEEADWARRADASLDREHNLWGRHGGWQFPRAFVWVGALNGSLFAIDAWRDDEWEHKVPGSVVSSGVIGPPGSGVLRFSQSFATTELAVVVEGTAHIEYTVLSSTEIRIDHWSNNTGAAVVLAIYEGA
jgi:hypothetical protein